MPADDLTVAIEPHQERILRMCKDQMTAEELGRMCGRSKAWARLALRQLGLETPRMRAHRVSRERRAA